MAQTPAISLATPIGALGVILPRVATKLQELGIRTLADLLTYWPFKHERLEAESSIADLVPGHLVSARGTISATRLVRGRKTRFEAVLLDDSGRLDLVWFNMPYLHQSMHPGDRIRVQGKAVAQRGGLEMTNPRHERLAPALEEPAATDSRLRPVYSTTEGLKSSQIETAIRKALPLGLPLIIDHFDEAFRKSRNLPSLAEAFRFMHEPESEDQTTAGRRRVAYDELFLLQLGLAIKRHERRDQLQAPALRWTEQIDERIRKRFAFTLTPAQDSVVQEISQDLRTTTPAHRLIQGDVGAGKTVVALYAMLMAVASEKQAALMAPTELLASQHFASISAMLKGSKVRMALLTGDRPAPEREAVRKALAAGDIDLVVGTHALLSETVSFADLGVAVIDEQHRFGVHQRAALRSKGASAGDKPGSPHVLVMTATPIPRTLALTLFGDLDVSTIKGLPPGRKPVKTRVVGPETAPEVYAWVRTRLDKGEQAYIVAPAIDPVLDSPDAPGSLASVRELRERLEAGPLAGKRLEVLHGQLPVEQRADIVSRFRAGKIDALVCTTVIEVGVDVPNAAVMVIEHAERFGLAQLHQLRGRVGRGAAASVCVLIAQPTTPQAESRLAVIASTSDGFALAEKDLEIRGFGDLVGLRQSGLPAFKVVQLPKDLDLLTLARRDAAQIAPKLMAEGWPPPGLLGKRLLRTHGKWLGLAGSA